MDIRIEPATKEDLPQLMDIYITAFGNYPAEAALIGDRVDANHTRLVGQNHLRAWEIHAEQQFPWPVGIKAVVTDPATGHDVIVGHAEWYIFDRERTEDEYTRPPYILAGSWIDNPDKRQWVAEQYRPVRDMRHKYLRGRPHGLLAYLCVHESWRRKGIAGRLVRWGMDRCKALGIMAYLEASEDGRFLYQKLGFEAVGELVNSDGSVNAVMVWEPRMEHGPGT